MAKSLHDPRYRRLIEKLIAARDEAGLTQRDLAERLKRQPSFVAKTELIERRLDLIELIDWLAAVGHTHPLEFLSESVAAAKLPKRRSKTTPKQGDA